MIFNHQTIFNLDNNKLEPLKPTNYNKSYYDTNQVNSLGTFYNFEIAKKIFYGSLCPINKIPYNNKIKLKNIKSNNKSSILIESLKKMNEHF